LTDGSAVTDGGGTRRRGLHRRGAPDMPPVRWQEEK
jgi:hypothetical protein